MKYKLTIIIPTYNEQKTILKVLDSLNTQNELKQISWQAIIVDDGSTDKTYEILQNSLIAKQENIKIIKHPNNYGKGKAIRSAIPYIEGTYTIIKDADLENSVDDIPKLLNEIENKNLSVLYGSRRLEPQNNDGQGNLLYYLGGNFMSIATNILYKQKLTDAPTCYKIFDTKLLKTFTLSCDGFEFCQEVTALVSKKGIKIKEIPIKYFPRSRQEGKKLSWKHGLRALWTLLKYKFKK
jgi:dolichol-phosphate mannosyltransferase